jgi:hypothetical protein
VKILNFLKSTLSAPEKDAFSAGCSQLYFKAKSRGGQHFFCAGRPDFFVRGVLQHPPFSISLRLIFWLLWARKTLCFEGR